MTLSTQLLSRRNWLRLSTAGVVSALGGSSFLEPLAAELAGDQRRVRSCILLWMSGGPSQMETFDPKPGHENGGPTKAIATSVPGIQISEHLPGVARMMDEMAIIRSMSTKEGDHSRATYLLRTGNLPQGPIEYPALGSLVSKEAAEHLVNRELPQFVSIGPNRFISPRAFGSGFLGPHYAPFVVGANGYNVNQGEDSLQIQNLQPPQSVAEKRVQSRLEILNSLEDTFAADHPDIPVASHRSAYQQATEMMQGVASKVFDLSQEPDRLREQYGRNQFGQGCLLARRLVERGVPFVEVSLNNTANGQGLGWDTHTSNFDTVAQLCGVLDPAWATLMQDLKNRGLLESTLVVWMGEFGRTPQINGSGGRDHYPNAWSTVLAGGGIRGGTVVGATSESGENVEGPKHSVPDLLATICGALGIDSMKQNMSNVGRPIRIVDPKANPIREALL